MIIGPTIAVIGPAKTTTGSAIRPQTLAGILARRALMLVGYGGEGMDVPWIIACEKGITPSLPPGAFREGNISPESG
jgi:hypothetical protein